MEKMVLPEGDFKGLHEALGLDDERFRVLCKEIQVIFDAKPVEGKKKMLSEDLNELLPLCETTNELVWAVFNFGVNVGFRKAPKMNVVNVGMREFSETMKKGVAEKKELK